MNHKKATRLFIACIIILTAIFSVKPATFEAASNVAAVVNSAKNQMKKSYTTYFTSVKKTGKLPPKSIVLAEFNKANKLYTNAKGTIQKSGGKMKKKYLAELNDAYKMYITNRVVPYINAYKILEDSAKAKSALQNAIVDEDLEALQNTHTKLGNYLTDKQLKIYKKVYDLQTRNIFLKEFNNNKTLYNKYVNDIIVNKKLSEATEHLEEGKLADAKKALNTIHLLLGKTSNTFKADLTKEYQDLLEVYTYLITPLVPELDFVEGTNGKIILYFDIAVTSLNIDDVKITMAINGGSEEVVNPLDIALSTDKTTGTITVNQVLASDEDQSIVYFVEYKGKKISADAFTVAKN
jgi:hypothetical protein